MITSMREDLGLHADALMLRERRDLRIEGDTLTIRGEKRKQEERDERGYHIINCSIGAGIKEQVHVGIGFMRGRHMIFGNRQHELHVQVLDIPVDGFLGVLAAVGDVVDALDEAVGGIVNVDLAEVAVRLNQAQFAYQASSSVFNTLRGLTLLDVLK